MHRGSDCPDARSLEQLIRGELPDAEAEPLERHLADCDRCARLADALPAGGVLVEAMRGRSPILDGIEGPAVERLIGRALGLCPGDTPAPPRTEVTVPEAELLDPPERPDELGRLGPYRVLKLLGSGGMGVVYLAWQPRPQRLVALKVGLTQQRLARLRGETEFVARLHHPNIVAVYEAGEHRGSPFYTMEYMEGGSLAQKLAAALPAPRAAAELVATLARAVQHAHEQGVVHRDLKPANVLLAKDGTPKVADFGLAKRLAGEPGASATGDQTASGAILGTPGYMAPEQASGRSRDAGPATDVYALGAILYESLTGRPPFRAATVLETLAQVRDEEPIAPSRLQPGLSRDLQTVCLKCLHKEPGRRYSSSAALADDLDRFVRGEPVRARPVAAWERAWKWVRRNPAAAALVLVVVLALAGVVAGVVTHNVRLREEVRREEAQRERADANYREARSAIGQILARADARSTSGVPRILELRREQREAALAFYLRVAEQQGGSPEVRHDVAGALWGAGELQVNLGRNDEARKNLERAIELFTELAAEFPAERTHRADKAECLNLLGYCHPPGDGRLRCFREALVLREEQFREDPASRVHRSLLASAHVGVANGLMMVPDKAKVAATLAEIERHYLRAEELRTALVEEEPGERNHRKALAKIWVNLAVSYQTDHDRRLADFRRCHDRAEEALERLVGEDPQDTESLLDLANLRVSWSYEQDVQKQQARALADLTKSVPPLEDLIRREPDAEQTRRVLLRTYGVRAGVLDHLKRHEEALADWKRLLELSRNEPERGSWRLLLALYCIRAGRHAEAVREVESMTAPIANVPRTNQLIHLAQVCGAAVAAARADEKLPPKERETLSGQYAAKALEFLAQARSETGAEKWPEAVRLYVHGNDDFELLRDREEFRRLVPPEADKPK